MKKRLLTIVLASFCGILISAGSGYAVLLNPDSTAWYDDNGTSLYRNTGPMVSFEVFDYLGSLGVGSEFGFYYESAPGTRIPLLAGPEKVAVVDFFTGTVMYVLTSGAASFTPRDDEIGFYYGFSTGILYSDPTLNPAGMDLFYSFESKNPAAPNYHLMAFENPAFPGNPLSVEVTGGIKAVPEPPTVLLLGLGLLGVGALRKRLLTGMN